MYVVWIAESEDSNNKNKKNNSNSLLMIFIAWSAEIVFWL